MKHSDTYPRTSNNKVRGKYSRGINSMVPYLEISTQFSCPPPAACSSRTTYVLVIVISNFFQGGPVDNKSELRPAVFRSACQQNVIFFFSFSRSTNRFISVVFAAPNIRDCSA